MTAAARIERWWIGVTLCLLLCIASVVVALVTWPRWLDQPLAPERETAGVVEELDSSGTNPDGIAIACATSDEHDEFDEELGLEQFEYIRVARIDGDRVHACWREGILGPRGRLVDEAGDEVIDPVVLARTGVVPGNDGRTRAGILIWGLLYPLFTVAWTYLYQRLLVTSRFFRWLTWLGTGVMAVSYFYAVVSSFAQSDGPGALASSAGAITVFGALLLGRLTIGRVSREPAVGDERQPPREESALATVLDGNVGASEPRANRRRRGRRGRRARRNRQARQAEAQAPVPEAPVPQPTSAVPSPPSGPIDVNSAAEHVIASVPGVGPIAARRIVERRNERGRIGDFDEFCEIVEPTRRVRRQLQARVEFGRGGVPQRSSNPEHEDPDDPYGGRRVDL